MANQNGVLFKDKIKLPNNLPDIDYLIFDQKTNIVFIIELKFLLKANDYKEKLARDSEIQNGIKQILKYKDYVLENINKIINNHLHITPNVKDICFFLLSKNGLYSGNYNMEIPVISHIMFERLLIISKFNFKMIFNRILERSYLPEKQVGYTEETIEFEFGGINFSIPFLMPIIIPEVNTLLQADSERYQNRKVERNAPCPCGSGKKYKKCCGRIIN